MNPFSILVLGPPGTGKSWFAGSATNDGDWLLLATKPRESNSAGYAQLAPEQRELFFDLKWAPEVDMSEADALLRFNKRLWQLYDDAELDGVIIDNWTDLEVLVDHELYKDFGITEITQLGRDTLSFYGSKKKKLQHLANRIIGLSHSAKKPKYVIVVGHTQPAKEDQTIKVEGQKIMRPSADKRAQGIEYEGSVLPMVESSYRQKIQGDFDVVVFSHIRHGAAAFQKSADGGFSKSAPAPEWYLQIQPDAERHAIVHAGVATVAECANEWNAFLEAIGR